MVVIAAIAIMASQNFAKSQDKGIPADVLQELANDLTALQMELEEAQGAIAMAKAGEQIYNIEITGTDTYLFAGASNPLRRSEQLFTARGANRSWHEPARH